MKRFIIITLSVLAIIVIAQDFFAYKKRIQPKEAKPYVVMLSLDGFRWDYDTKAQTPMLDFITKNGTKAYGGLQPCFPSKTFPNHYSIATGLYPEHHELISNAFYAPDLKKYYSVSNRAAVENGKFYKGEPIWVTAEAQQVISASYFWVGSECKIKGYEPTYTKKYDHHFPYKNRADTVLYWLNLPDELRPHLITWYIDKADGVGHDFGPESIEMAKTIEELDSLIGYFMNGINKLPIKDSVTFIIVSDHGMSAINPDKIVHLEKYIKPQWIDTAMGSNPFFLLYPNKKCTDSVLQSLKNVQGVLAWQKDSIPERLHLNSSERLSDVVVVADSGWSIGFNKKINYMGGTHGYDNQFKDMYGIFYAMGSNIKKGYNANTLYNVDIYNLISNILSINPAPNDGEPQRIMHVLIDPTK